MTEKFREIQQLEKIEETSEYLKHGNCFNPPEFLTKERKTVNI